MVLDLGSCIYSPTLVNFLKPLKPSGELMK